MPFVTFVDDHHFRISALSGVNCFCNLHCLLFVISCFWYLERDLMLTSPPKFPTLASGSAGLLLQIERLDLMEVQGCHAP